MPSDMNLRYAKYQCWMCEYFESRVTDPFPPPQGALRYCIRLNKPRGTNHHICKDGQINSARKDLILDYFKHPERYDTTTEIVPSFSDSDSTEPEDIVIRAIRSADPSQHYRVSPRKAGLAKSQLEDLVRDRVLIRYSRSSGYTYRLAREYRHRIPKKEG